MKSRILFGASALALSVGAGVSPAGAAPFQEGLVNVYAEDTTVQIPVALAANVCGVDINVLTSNIGDAPVTCTADGVSIAQDSDGSNGPVQQRGLVNVALVDTTVQVPVSVAANICGVDVNVLAEAVEDAAVDCDALADAGSGG